MILIVVAVTMNKVRSLVLGTFRVLDACLFL